MPLQIQSIHLHDFRQYRDFRLDGIGRLTVFVGPNAVGKTSIIEAIQLLTALTTLRHCPAQEMIRFGEENARIEVLAGDGSRELEIALALSGKSRRYMLNGKAKRIGDLRGTVPAVTFSPDDLELAKGPHGMRRRALDHLGVQLNANYLQLTHDFDKIQKHKNKLLKEDAPQALLDAVNETFAQVSVQLTNYRRRMFERLLPHMQRLYSQLVSNGSQSGEGTESEIRSGLSGEEDKTPRARNAGVAPVPEELFGEYAASWEASSTGPSLLAGDSEISAPESSGAAAVPPASLQEALRLRTQEERARARALEGAHLDRISFTIGGADAQRFASQGQQRSLVLAWKLAEVELVREILHQPPILLLDDVMSELDAARRAALMEYLSHDLQTFITTANADYFTEEMLSEADIIKLPIL